jgi:hypothetical protein
MRLVITIEMDNAAFSDPEDGGRHDLNRAMEVARILREYVDKCEGHGTVLDARLMDANGNNVGHAEVQ